MAQTLSNIICKSQLQATMATSTGRTNVLTNPKIGSTVSHTLTSSSVDVAYSFTATGASSGTDEFKLTWSTGSTVVSSTGSTKVTFTMRENPLNVTSSNSAKNQQDPEGIAVNLTPAGDAQTIATLVAVLFETPAANTGDITFQADASGYGGGYSADYIGDFKFKGGDAKSRSVLIVPQAPIGSGEITDQCLFSIAGSIGNKITITVLGQVAS